MVVANDIARMWLARDAAQSGLYTLWAYNKPDMNKEGYFRSSPECGPRAVLLMSIHPAKFPWDALKLDRGEVVELEMGVTAVDKSNTVMLET